MKLTLFSFYLTLIVSVFCQDHARRGGAVVRRRNNFRGPLLAFVAGGLVGGAVGVAVQTRRLNSIYKIEKTDLLQYIQLQDEVHKARDKQWQEEYTKVYKAYEELDKETVERDYEEFKAPDTNNDDMISRVEFNTYVRKYLSSFPELSEKDFPKFEEFDLDGDGNVSFEEWQQFLQIQKQMEAKKAKNEAGSGTSKVYKELVDALYEQSNKADGFNALDKNIEKASKGQRKVLGGRAY